MGKNHIPTEWPIPVPKPLRLSDIVDVHPAVRTMLATLPAEQIVGLRGVSDAPINDVFGFPRIAVVPVRQGSGYWCWIGVRAYRRLVSRNWRGKIIVLDYGSRMPERWIVHWAEKDWKYASAFTGQSAKSDRATAQEWEAETKDICTPAKSDSRRRPCGLNAYAKLRGLHPRHLRADNSPKRKKSADKPGITTDNSHDEGSKD